MIFMPMLKGHHWVDVLTGKTETTTIVDCSSADPCPDQQHVVQRVVLPPSN
jgi:hypothetical protein